MKKNLILLLLVLTIQNTDAQELHSQDDNSYSMKKIVKKEWVRKNLDSLFKKVTEKKDTNNVKVLNEIAYNYSIFTPDSAFIYGKKALQISEQINYIEGKISALYNLTLSANNVGDLSTAIFYLNETYRTNQQQKDTTLMIENLTEIANLWLSAKDYKTSLEYSNKAFLLASSYKKVPQGADRNYLSSLNSDLNLYIGEAYYYLGKKDSALYYYNRSYESVSWLGEFYDGWKTFPLFQLAKLSFTINDYEIAIGYLNKIVSLNIKKNSGENISSAVLYSKIYLAQGKIDSAIKYISIYSPKFSSSLNISDSVNSIDAVETMVKIYEKGNLKDSTLKYQALLIVLKDAAFNLEQLKKLEEIKFKEKIKDIEIEEKKLYEEKERNNNIKLGLISIFIPTFASLVFYFSKKKKKNTRVITLMGIVSLLMLFEFISLLIHPYIEKITHHDAFLMYLTLLLIASLLVPLHHKLEQWVKEKI